MGKINETIEGLRRQAGVKGAAVIMADGLVAAESLDARYRSEVLAGLTSYLLMTTNRSLREGGLGECTRFVMHATHGKVMFLALRDAFLVVVFDQFADLQAVSGAVQEATERLRTLTQLA